MFNSTSSDRNVQLYSEFIREKNKLFCLCEFSKAFDKVWYKGLLLKFNAYGIQVNIHVLNWFNSYHQGRQGKSCN